MRRSEFLKMSCAGCMLSAAGLITASALLESCSPKAGGGIVKAKVTDKQMAIPLSSISSGKVTIVRGKGMEYDVAVHSKENGEYEALLLRCTHFSNPLTINGERYECSLHGSQFGINGEVKKGPASAPLQKLRLEVVKNSLIIHV